MRHPLVEQIRVHYIIFIRIQFYTNAAFNGHAFQLDTDMILYMHIPNNISQNLNERTVILK